MAELKGDTRQRLITAAIRSARLYGIGALRVQQVGALAGVVPSSIYTYFGGKEVLLQACFQQVAQQIGQVFARARPDPAAVARDPTEALRGLWSPYWRWLLRHPDEAVFFHRYRDSSEGSCNAQLREDASFRPFFESMALFEETWHIRDRLGSELLWLHLLSVTALYAKYVIEGTLADTEETEVAVFRLVTQGPERLSASG